MNNSVKKLLILIAICFLFIFAGSGNVFSKCGEGGYENRGEGVSAQVIENNASRNEKNPGVDIYYDDNSVREENIKLADNIGNQDPIDSTELNDPIDRTEVEDPIDKEDRDHHPINSAEKGQAAQGNDIDNDGDN